MNHQRNHAQLQTALTALTSHLLLIVLTSTVRLVDGGFANIKRDIIELAGNVSMGMPEEQLRSLMPEGMEDNLRFGGAGDKYRAFTGWIESSIEKLDSYGCWCYFSTYGLGKGKPLSEIDNFCKQLHDGYECAMIESETETASCVPWSTDYVSGYSVGVDLLYDECRLRNLGDQCAINACTIEGNFVLSMFDSVVGNIGIDVINENYLHAEGFDPTENCLTQPSIWSERSCCGDYPLRRPYKTFNGERQCCGYNTFDATLYTCCEDDVIRLVC